MILQIFYPGTKKILKWTTRTVRLRVEGLSGFLFIDKIFYNPDDINLAFKHYHWLVGLYVLFYTLTNILAVKECHFFIFTFLAGLITYPFSYCICDIVTEVYGFQRARQLVYFGVFCSYLFIACIKLADILPTASFWHSQDVFHEIFNSQEPRIIVASTIATIAGDLVNCKVIAKLKIHIYNLTLFRFISATAIGTLVDNTVFILLVFVSNRPIEWMLILLANQYALKLLYSALLAPLSVRISGYLKKSEKADIYDSRTNFSPFKIRVTYTKKDNYYGRDFDRDDR